MNKKIKKAIIISFFIEIPIWFYLIYWILVQLHVQLHPDRLILFLFYIYILLLFLASFLTKLIIGEILTKLIIGEKREVKK